MPAQIVCSRLSRCYDRASPGVILGEQSQSAQPHRLARELIGTGRQRFGRSPASRKRSRLSPQPHVNSKLLKGIFQIALQQAESFTNALEQAEIRRFHAVMRIDRAAPGDREKAETLLGGALETYALSTGIDTLRSNSPLIEGSGRSRCKLNERSR